MLLVYLVTRKLELIKMFRNIPIWLFLGLICWCQNLEAQVFWSEDFENGLPSDWMVLDESNQDVFWTYCNNPNDNNGANLQCPEIWPMPPNLQKAFEASTSENGFMVLNSDAYDIQIIEGDQFYEAILQTSKIDCSNAPTVFLEFQSHIGLYVLPAFNNTLVQVSHDGENWTNFEAFPNLIPAGTVDPGFLRWSKNPEKTYIDISSVAALQEEVYIRWYWKGEWELYWAIDDIILSVTDTRPEIDLTLKPRGNYMAIPPNYNTPVSQIEPMHFMAEVKNLGQLEQSNIDLSLTITANETGQIIYEEHLPITTLRSDDEVLELLFPVFDEELSIGKYELEYRLGDFESDENPEDNLFRKTFSVSEFKYNKDNGSINIPNLSPGPAEFNTSKPLNWAIGNYFYFPNGTNHALESISFGLSMSQTVGGISFNPAGLILEVNLYSWRDLNLDGDAQSEECFKVATEDFVTTGFDQFVKMPLTNTLSPGDPVEFQNNTAYLAMLELKTEEFGKTIAVRGSSGLEYIGMEIATERRANPRYSSFISIGDETTFRFGGFASDVTPYIQLNIEPLTNAVNEKNNPIKSIQVTPNPSRDRINFTIPKNKIDLISYYQIVDAIGKIYLQDQSKNSNISLDVHDLPTGIYFLKVSNGLDQYLQKISKY